MSEPQPMSEPSTMFVITDEHKLQMCAEALIQHHYPDQSKIDNGTDEDAKLKMHTYIDNINNYLLSDSPNMIDIQNIQP